MEKTVLLVLLDQYADWEAAYVASGILALGQGRFRVKTVSAARESIRSLGGLTTLPDYDAPSAPADFAGLLLIGGTSWKSAAAQCVKPLVESALQNGRVLGGICAASAYLGELGVLNHVRHTSNDLEDLKQRAGAAYTGEANYLRRQAVRDGGIVTANGTAALEFAREVLLALEAAPESKIDEWYNFHKLGCYEAVMPLM